MRKDTKTFLLTVLGIPAFLSAAWGINAADEATVAVYERDHETDFLPITEEPVGFPEEVVVEEPATLREPVVPVTAPAPTPTPAPVVIETPAPQPVVETPVKTVKKKSRRTRAS